MGFTAPVLVTATVAVATRATAATATITATASASGALGDSRRLFFGVFLHFSLNGRRLRILGADPIIA